MIAEHQHDRYMEHTGHRVTRSRCLRPSGAESSEAVILIEKAHTIYFLLYLCVHIASIYY